MISDPRCPYCAERVGIDFEEPGDWCSDDNLPDGEFEMKCSNCDKTVNIIVDWRPTFYAEEPEDY